MRRLLAGVVALLLAATYLTSAFAQSGTSVRQSGTITPNTVPYWVTSGVIAGNVNAADSPVSSFGVTQSGSQGVCANSARVSSGSWQSMCLGYVSGQPTITVQANGGASQQALQFIVNGTTYPFPGALSGITVGSTPVTGGINNDCLTVGGSVLSQTNCSLLTAGTTGTGSIVLNGSPTLSGTIAGNLTWSGTQLWSGNVTAGSSLVVTGTSTPASAGGSTVVLGTVSAPTLANTAQAYLFNTTIGGAVLQGDGSTSDITLANKSGSAVLTVPTGTTGVTLPGVPILSGLSSGTCANGLALDSGNHVVTDSCPGAASSIQVGSTTISSGTSANILYNNGGTLGNETIASILTGGTGISITGTTNATVALTSARQTLPTTQRFTSGTNATYTTPANVLWIEIYMVGPGGGGAGSSGTGGSGSAGSGTSSASTCWNTSGTACTTPVYASGAGQGGTANGGNGGAGGTVSGSSTCNDSVSGANGNAGNNGAPSTNSGAPGANSVYGGGGAGTVNAAGGAGQANSGGGGASGSSTVQIIGGSGGAGAYCYAIIQNPAATYVYTVGTGGGAGTAGSGNLGGAGAAGRIYVVEHYGS